jgi:CDP-paratose 2-epimerase
MKILITGICGFAGSAIAEYLLARLEGVSICGIDNLMRPGSETNRTRLRQLGVQFIHGDIRCASDVGALPRADWVIDAAANPSVLAGVSGNGSSRQLLDHNLVGCLHILEYCKKHASGFILLSTSRVYSIPRLAQLPLKDNGDAFELNCSTTLPAGVSENGISPAFSTEAPVSLYGSTKLACEILALEYGFAFDFPVWINRCGVLTGAGQFGTPEQGIFSFWVNAHLRRRPLKYIGFDGRGKQVRDALHPSDLTDLLILQMRTATKSGTRIYTAGGGKGNAISLRQVNAWCDERFGTYQPASDTQPRPYDIPWVVMDSSEALLDFGWAPRVTVFDALTEIAEHAQAHPDWLDRSRA